MKRTTEELTKLSTKRLLAYYRSQRNKFKLLPYNYIGFEYEKEYKETEEHLKEVKSILDSRENV